MRRDDVPKIAHSSMVAPAKVWLAARKRFGRFAMTNLARHHAHVHREENIPDVGMRRSEAICSVKSCAHLIEAKWRCLGVALMRGAVDEVCIAGIKHKMRVIENT